MASFRCYDNSDVIATLIITNFHLYLIQLWWQFFQIFVYGDVVYAQTWEVLTLKNCIEPPRVPSAIFRLCFFCFSLFYFLQFLRIVFNVYSCSKQDINDDENIVKNIESLVAMTHDGNCCENFLQFRRSQVVKSSLCLRFSIFLLCRQVLLRFFQGFHLL